MRIILLFLMIISAYFTTKGKDIQKQDETEKIKIDTYEKIAENLSQEQKQQLEELGLGKDAMVYEVQSPILGFLMQKPESTSTKLYEFKIRYLAIKNYMLIKKKEIIDKASYLVEIMLVTYFLLWLFRLWSLLRMSANLFFKLSKFILLITSLLSIIMIFGFNTNLWNDTNYVIFWFPVSMFCMSALGLRLLDYNFPIWKTLYSGHIFPIISGICILLKDYIKF